MERHVGASTTARAGRPGVPPVIATGGGAGGRMVAREGPEGGGSERTRAGAGIPAALNHFKNINSEFFPL